ncbi:MAG: patatin-like phospholipase family protein [Desulfobacterales bacterium]
MFALNTHGPMQCAMIVIVTLLLGACAHYPVNQKVSAVAELNNRKAAIEERLQASKELLLVLAFSGGGTRAAALSYGVLEALARVELPPAGPTENQAAHGPRRLLDEVNIISSVSGGSFTAAYYGLHGDRMFQDYKQRFLLKNVTRAIISRVLFNPYNWMRLWSPTFGRSDLAAEYYDNLLFDGATLGDIRTDGPAILIQATDIIDGQYFAFTLWRFKFTCSDWINFPVSRAVAASAAFPGPFGPIILKNYAGQCDYETPEWITSALAERDVTSRQFQTAKQLNTLADSEVKPFIHLLDGGIADNLGIRGVTEIMSVRGVQEGFGDLGIVDTKRIAFIIVNAETRKINEWGLLGGLPGLLDTIGITSSIMIKRYNYETLHLLRDFLKEEREKVKRGERTDNPPEIFIIEVGFEALKDTEERNYFSSVPTTLNLPEEQVDRLRAVAGKILFSAPDFKRLVHELGGRLPPLEGENK